MTRRPLVLLLALFALAGTTALSQRTRPPPDDARNYEPKQDALARRMMHAFADCVAASEANAQRLFALEPGTDAQNRHARQIANARCLPEEAERGMLRFDVILLRGGLYEGRYRRVFSDPQPDRFDAVPPLVYPWSDSATPPQVRQRNIATLRFAECVVRASPSRVRALLGTEVTTHLERQAFDAMRPDLATCLANGVTITLTRPVLRGLVAEAIYRLSIAHRVQAAQAGRTSQ